MGQKKNANDKSLPNLCSSISMVDILLAEIVNSNIAEGRECNFILI